MAKRKNKLKRKRWTKEEVKHLKRIFRNMRTADVAKEMNRTVPSVQQKAIILGLKKTKKYLKSIGKA
jgi:hypothetical protein